MSSELKIIGGIVIVSIVIIVGAVFFFSKEDTTNIPKEEIVSNNGLHWHPKLSITIKGENQEIPANIGIGAVHAPIHTHDTDNKQGVLHMEMQGVVTKDETRLGNFFRVWGKEFNSTKVFDKTNGSDGKVKMLVNGKENKEFENYHMQDNDFIEIIYE